MKKTLLLSVVASTMIMAGGDITPVEPVTETPETQATQAPVSDWTFNGQAVVYYQTAEAGEGSLFDQENAGAAAGIQLGAVNKDLIGGIGAGFELSGISSLGLEQDVVSHLVQSATGDLTGAAITQAYLTYGIGNTSLKVGRQELPKSLSPLAFSDDWNVFKNTFEAALLVNTDIPDTVVALAYVTRANSSFGPLDTFNDIHKANDNTYFAAVSNSSISNLTLTGSFYQLNSVLGLGDATAIWGDAQYKMGGYSIGLQGAVVDPTDVKDTLVKTNMFGAKIGAKMGMFDATVAYSTVDEGTVKLNNIAGLSGERTALYTQLLANADSIASDNDTVAVKLHASALGGTFVAEYAATTDNSMAANDTTELDLAYVTTVGKATLFAGYVLRTADQGEDTNVVRVWARYAF